MRRGRLREWERCGRRGGEGVWITFKATTKANDTVGCADSVKRKFAKECVSCRGRNVEGSKEGDKRDRYGAGMREDENV